jgi:hypothetical protein
VLIAVLIGFSASADGLSGDPEAKIRPPVGLTSQEPTEHSGVNSNAPNANRIRPPGGVASSAKIGPPIGAPTPTPDRSLFELFWMWLATQARINPPVG